MYVHGIQSLLRVPNSQRLHVQRTKSWVDDEENTFRNGDGRRPEDKEELGHSFLIQKFKTVPHLFPAASPSLFPNSIENVSRVYKLHSQFIWQIVLWKQNFVHASVFGLYRTSHEVKVKVEITNNGISRRQASASTQTRKSHLYKK